MHSSGFQQPSEGCSTVGPCLPVAGQLPLPTVICTKSAAAFHGLGSAAVEYVDAYACNSVFVIIPAVCWPAACLVQDHGQQGIS